MQKRIGLLGGMSWESTAVYYRLLNKAVSAKLGGLHSADILMHSVDFDAVSQLQHEADWASLATMLTDSAKVLVKGGAQAIAIATNTMHIVADSLSDELSVPVIHIADTVADACKQRGCHTPALLGTRFTMEQPFYRERLAAKGLNVVIPADDERAQIHAIIYDELCKGHISDASRTTYLEIINNLKARGANSVILGCTEIGLLVDQSHTDVPLFDTTHIHASAIADFMTGSD